MSAVVTVVDAGALVTGARLAGAPLAGALVAMALLVWPRRPRRPRRSRRSRRSVADRPPQPSAAQVELAVPVPVLLDLVRAALDAGLPPGRALEVVWSLVPSSVDAGRRRALHALASGWQVPTSGRDGFYGSSVVDQAAGKSFGRPDGAEFAPLARALVLAGRTGASIGVLLRQAAADERAARRRRASVAAARLGVRLVLPLGLTTLPAFILLGVAPVVIGLADDILRSG